MASSICLMRVEAAASEMQALSAPRVRLRASATNAKSLRSKRSKCKFTGRLSRKLGGSSDRVPAEHIGRAVERIEAGPHRRHRMFGDGLRRPAFGAVHRAHRPRLADQRYLV